MSPTRLENRAGALMLGDLGLASAVLTFLSESPRRSKPMARGAGTRCITPTHRERATGTSWVQGEKHQKPVALKGRGQPTKPQPRQDDQDP